MCPCHGPCCSNKCSPFTLSQQIRHYARTITEYYARVHLACGRAEGGPSARPHNTSSFCLPTEHSNMLREQPSPSARSRQTFASAWRGKSCRRMGHSDGASGAAPVRREMVTRCDCNSLIHGKMRPRKPGDTQSCKTLLDPNTESTPRSFRHKLQFRCCSVRLVFVVDQPGWLHFFTRRRLPR